MSDPLNIRIGRATNAATAVNLDTDRVLPQEWWNVGYVALSNNSGETVTAQIALVTGAEVDFLAASISVANGSAGAVLSAFTLGEGQQLRAIVTGTSDSGPVTFLVMGTHEYIHED